MARPFLNGVQLPSVAALPAAASNTGVILCSAGILWFSNGVAWIPITAVQKPAATVANSAAVNTAETYISAAYSLPAGTLYVGAAFRIVILGTCTSTAANVSTLTIRLGTAGTTADTAVLAAVCTAAASGTGVPFRFEAIVTIRTIGATGTVTAGVSLVNSGVTGISNAAAVVSGTGATAAVNTTVGNFLGASIKSAGTTTTSTITQATVEQIA